MHSENVKEAGQKILNAFSACYLEVDSILTSSVWQERHITNFQRWLDYVLAIRPVSRTVPGMP